MRVTSLGSGSSGNALLVEAGPQGRTKLLVDAGLSRKMLTERLARAGVLPSQLSGVLVTHEHSDHVLGLPALVKRYAFPIVTDPRTFQAIEEGIATGIWRKDSGSLMYTVPEDTQDALIVHEQQCASEASEIAIVNSVVAGDAQPELRSLPVGSRCVLGDIEVRSFPTEHDAIAPCGYLLQAGGCRVCIVTDSGHVTPAMLDMMQHADLLIVESNHDRERLLRGPYPKKVKMRILSPVGHLSNDQAAEVILRTWRYDSVRWLWLAHLSRTNNTPSLALKSVCARLQQAGANLSQVHISVSPPDMGPVWDSTRLWHTPSLWNTVP